MRPKDDELRHVYHCVEEHQPTVFRCSKKKNFIAMINIKYITNSSLVVQDGTKAQLARSVAHFRGARYAVVSNIGSAIFPVTLSQ